jgi:2-polyprenyl-3-methyl-5-hydroxy-6-metoxy-1,4-benzoquinol methylase
MADQAAGWLSPWLRARRIIAARPFLRGRVLDFGCGVGEIARFVPPEDYVGVDRDADSLAIARRRFPKHRFGLTLDDGARFDTIAALAVLEHLADPTATWSTLSERLVDGGTIVLSTPHARFEWAHAAGARVGIFSRHACDEHQQLFDAARLETLARQSGLHLAHYQRFLLGANQLAVMRKGRRTDERPARLAGSAAAAWFERRS